MEGWKQEIKVSKAIKQGAGIIDIETDANSSWEAREESDGGEKSWSRGDDMRELDTEDNYDEKGTNNEDIPIGEFPTPMTRAEHNMIAWLKQNPDQGRKMRRQTLDELHISAKISTANAAKPGDI